MRNFIRLVSMAVLFLVVQSTATLSFVQNTPETAVKRLQEKGIRFEDDTFLRYAKAGNIEIVKLFLQAGINQDAVDPTGETALVIATRAHKFKVANLLLAKGADPKPLLNELKKAKGIGFNELGEFSSKLAIPLVALIAALFTWVYRRRQLKQEEIATLTGLVPHVASDKERAGALVILAHLANPKIASSLAQLYPSEGSALALIALVRSGKIKLNKNMSLFSQVLIDATRNGNKKAVTELLFFASDQKELMKYLIEAFDGEGRTALMWAARNNLDEIVETLLDNQSDVRKKDNKGKTALHLAAQRRSRGAMSKLIEYTSGIDLREIYESEDYKGRTVKSWAEKYGLEKILKDLEQKISGAT